MILSLVLIVAASATTAIAQVTRARPGSAANVSPAQRGVLVDIEEEVRVHGAGVAEHLMTLTSETIDQWIFNGPPDNARENYQSMINSEIQQIDAACTLSAEQKQMLQLAGAGELQNIREAVAMLHTQYAGRTFEQDKLGEVYQEFQKVQQHFLRRPLDSKSLLFKLVPTLLSPEQEELFAGWVDARQRMQLRGQIDAAVAVIEQRVPILHSQRQNLIELLESEILLVMPDADQFAFVIRQNAVLAQMNAIDGDKFLAFLNKAQWEAVQEVFLPHRSELRNLQQRGLIQKMLRPARAHQPPVVDELDQQRAQLLKQAEAIEATLTRKDAAKQPRDDAGKQGAERIP
jgi:hypothetical protein